MPGLDSRREQVVAAVAEYKTCCQVGFQQHSVCTVYGIRYVPKELKGNFLNTQKIRKLREIKRTDTNKQKSS